MKITAEKRVLEMSEQNISVSKTVYEVLPNETVENLMSRVGLSGSSEWHFSISEVRLKLVK